jgi:glucosylceramidase
MKELKKYFLMMLCMLITMQAQSNTATWISSTEGNLWQTKPAIALQSESSENTDIIVYLARPQQTFKGFGTCFNELGWDALNLTSTNVHKKLMKDFFAPDGDLRYTFGRIPIGANDYARSWYSSNETDQDFAMEHFNINRDKQTLIPYIKEALAENPDIDFWASPWSPPAWMKTNKHYANRSTKENGMPSDKAVPTLSANQFIQEPEYLEAYALYFSKFIDAYQEEGIDISMIMYQNEAYTFNDYPNCTWLPDGTMRFNAEYLVPKLRETHPHVEVFLGTMNTGNMQVFNEILSDPRAADTFAGVGFQWEGLGAISNIRNQYPNFRLMQTESECGSGTFDFLGAARHTFYLICNYIANGAEAYTFWNNILCDNGTSTWGWNQNALIRVNSQNGQATYTPEYYAVKHFSHFIVPGSIILESNQTPASNFLAAKTPDGKTVVVIGNNTNNTISRSLKVGNKYFNVNLPAQSFNTFVLEAESDETLDTEALTDKIAEANSLYADGSGEASDQLLTAIHMAEEALTQAVFQRDINAACQDIKLAILNYNLANRGAAGIVDMTALVVNANFDEGRKAWIRTGSGGNFVTNNATEFWHTESSLYQIIPNLPIGKYTLKARAFVTDSGESYLIANDEEVKLPKKLSSDESNNLTSAAASLAENDEYELTLQFNLLKRGDVRIGIDSRSNNMWTVFDDFELFYHGEDLDELNAALNQAILEAEAMYDNGKKDAENLQNAINAAKNTAQNILAISEHIENLQQAITNYSLVNASVDSPFDLSSRISNPSFETGLSGWDVRDMVISTNEHLKTKEEIILKDGVAFVEKWVSTGSTVQEAVSVSQTITNLPNGKYTLKAAAFSLYRNLSNMPADDSPRIGGFLFANDTNLPVGWREEYELTTTVFDGTITIGYKVQDPENGLNWIGCDNFRLYYCGEDMGAVVQRLEEQIIFSTTLTNSKMNTQVLDALNAAIGSAEVSAQQIPIVNEDVLDAAVQLQSATHDAENSIKAYDLLNNTLQEIEDRQESYQSYTGYDDFIAVCNETKEKYLFGEFTDSQIPNIIKELYEAEKACKFTQSVPFNISFVASNPSFEDGYYNIAPKIFIPNGWELDYSFPTDKDVRIDSKTPYDGSYIYNIWADRVGYINLYQDIDLPVGSYTLKAAMRSLDRPATDLLTNQHIYVQVGNELVQESTPLTAAGVTTTGVMQWEILSLDFNVTEENTTVRIGAASEGSGKTNWGGWFQIDDVQLKLNSHEPTSNLQEILLGDNKIIQKTYYNLQGVQIFKPVHNHVYIRSVIFENGKNESKKIIFIDNDK